MVYMYASSTASLVAPDFNTIIFLQFEPLVPMEVDSVHLSGNQGFTSAGATSGSSSAIFGVS